VSDPHLYSLRAAQGYAMRRLIASCTRALVLAIRERR
jgi:hypothetical protein